MIYTTVQKFRVGKILLMFLKEVLLYAQGSIYWIENKIQTVMLPFKIAVFYFNILEYNLILWFLIIINVKNNSTWYFCGN